MADLKRQQVGEDTEYKGRIIRVTHCGPDLLCHVDGAELPGFFVSRPAAISGAVRYINQLIKEGEK